MFDSKKPSVFYLEELIKGHAKMIDVLQDHALEQAKLNIAIMEKDKVIAENAVIQGKLITANNRIRELGDEHLEKKLNLLVENMQKRFGDLKLEIATELNRRSDIHADMVTEVEKDVRNLTTECRG